MHDANRSGEGSFPSTDEPAPAEPSFAERPNVQEMSNESDDDMGLLGGLGGLEPSAEYCISDMRLQEMGSSGRSYRREVKQGLQHIVSEIYSPPRVNAELRRRRWRHLVPGLSPDLTVNGPPDGQPWDVRKEAKITRARELIRKQKPFMLIGSPECVAFRNWQYLNETMANAPQLQKTLKRNTETKLHIDFVASLYREQIEGGTYFLHAHPNHATSWELGSMADPLEPPGVGVVRGDQCQYGAEAIRGPGRVVPRRSRRGS